MTRLPVSILLILVFTTSCATNFGAERNTSYKTETLDFLEYGKTGREFAPMISDRKLSREVGRCLLKFHKYTKKATGCEDLYTQFKDGCFRKYTAASDHSIDKYAEFQTTRMINCSISFNFAMLMFDNRNIGLRANHEFKKEMETDLISEVQKLNIKIGEDGTVGFLEAWPIIKFEPIEYEYILVEERTIINKQ